MLLLRDVTQFGSVSALGAESRRFKSCHPELNFTKTEFLKHKKNLLKNFYLILNDGLFFKPHQKFNKNVLKK